MELLPLEIVVPECVAKRWGQSLRLDRPDDWMQAAEYCGDLAMMLYRANGYNADDAVFRTLCKLGRLAFRRAGSRLQELRGRRATVQ